MSKPIVEGAEDEVFEKLTETERAVALTKALENLSDLSRELLLEHCVGGVSYFDLGLERHMTAKEVEHRVRTARTTIGNNPLLKGLVEEENIPPRSSSIQNSDIHRVAQKIG